MDQPIGLVLSTRRARTTFLETPPPANPNRKRLCPEMLPRSTALHRVLRGQSIPRASPGMGQGWTSPRSSQQRALPAAGPRFVPSCPSLGARCHPPGVSTGGRGGTLAWQGERSSPRTPAHPLVRGPCRDAAAPRSTMKPVTFCSIRFFFFCSIHPQFSHAQKAAEPFPSH